MRLEEGESGEGECDFLKKNRIEGFGSAFLIRALQRSLI